MDFPDRFFSVFDRISTEVNRLADPLRPSGGASFLICLLG